MLCLSSNVPYETTLCVNITFCITIQHKHTLWYYHNYLMALLLLKYTHYCNVLGFHVLWQLPVSANIPNGYCKVLDVEYCLLSANVPNGYCKVLGVEYYL